MRLSRRIALVGARWWHRWSTRPGYRARVRRTTVVAIIVVVVSIIVAKLLWGSSGPGIAAPFAYAALFFAAVILFAVAIASSDAFVDELEASHPPRVRTRRGFVYNAQRIIRVLSAGIAAIDAMLIHNVTRESVARWSRALGEMLCGVPPLGAAPAHAHAGPLARPAPAPRESRPAPVSTTHHTDRRSRRPRPVRTRHRASAAPPTRNRRRSPSRIVARLNDSRDSDSRP